MSELVGPIAIFLIVVCMFVLSMSIIIGDK
jgi:hypothetical protein